MEINMISNPEKNKIQRVFFKYARLGLDREDLPVFDAYRKILGCCRSEREAYELLAVYDTVRLLDLAGKDDVCRAVRDIYFYCGRFRPHRNDISALVRRFACQNFCDDRTVYRKLSYARKIYAGLLGRSAKYFKK